MLRAILLINSQGIRRRGDDWLQVIVEREAIPLAQVAGFVDTQDDRLQMAVEAAQGLRGTYLPKVMGADSLLDWLKDCVLADALLATQHKSVVELLAGALDALGRPF